MNDYFRDGEFTKKSNDEGLKKELFEEIISSALKNVGPNI